MYHNGVSVYYQPSDGTEWARYVHDKLVSRDYEIKCILNNFSCQKTVPKLSKVVNVFLVTPDFLDYPDWDVTRQVDRDTCITVLTGVDSVDFEQAARLYNCAFVLDWYTHELDNTEESVRDMLVSIISLYESTDLSNHIEVPQHRPHRVISGIYENDTWGEDEYDTLPPTRCLKGMLVEEDDEYDILPPARQVNGLVTAFTKVSSNSFFHFHLSPSH